MREFKLLFGSKIMDALNQTLGLMTYLIYANIYRSEQIVGLLKGRYHNNRHRWFNSADFGGANINCWIRNCHYTNSDRL